VAAEDGAAGAGLLVTAVSGLSGGGGLPPGMLVVGSDMTNPALRG
jgi:hypothetical protein